MTNVLDISQTVLLCPKDSLIFQIFYKIQLISENLKAIFKVHILSSYPRLTELE